MNENNVKISVIMPIYNAEKYLKESLDSVLNQTLDEIEIICVNDGSKDNSLSIIKEYAKKDSRIKIIDKENSGYGASVNIGIEKAIGDFIAIFEPDDILDKSIYEVLYTNAINYDLSVVKCNFYYYWSTKNKSKRSGLIKKCARKEPFEPKNNLKMFECHASVWAGIYKKSFLVNNDIKFLETPGASYQDISFYFKVLVCADKIMLLEKPLLYYRLDNPNSSINNPNKVFCVCDEYKEITNFLNNHQDIKPIFNTQKLINQYGCYLWNMKRITDSLKKSFLDRFSTEFKNFYKDGEITKDFYKSVNEKDLKLLINKPQVFINKVIFNKILWWL